MDPLPIWGLGNTFLFQLLVMRMLCNTKSRTLSMTFFSQFSRVQMSSGQEKQMVMCVDVFLMDSPSWPWQISVVPVVPSTNTAFSLISLRDGARGGQREHTTTRSQSRSSHTDVLSFPPCASYPDALSLPFSISRVLS